MIELMAHPYSILLSRLILGGTFLLSGSGKLFDRQGTIRQVIAYDILPERLARIYGLLFPWVEVILAGLLLAGLWTRYASLGLIMLLISFAIAVGVNLARGRQMNCGCFGRGAYEPLGWGTLTRITFLLILSTIIAIWDSGFLAINSILSSEKPNVSNWPSLSGFLPLLIIASVIYLAYRIVTSMISVVRDHRLLEVELRGKTFTRIS
jgi:uncharacterized membrane protein YphA (DoxX/SURF4 family)